MRIHRRRKPKVLNASAVAGRIKKVRRHVGCSQEEMSRLVGSSKSAYGKNERGNTLPQAETLAALHDKLGISVEWLLFNRGPMFWKNQGNAAGTLDTKNAEPSLSSEIEEMTVQMKRIPFLHHAVMGFYLKFKLENQHLIDETIEQQKKN